MTKTIKNNYLSSRKNRKFLFIPLTRLLPYTGIILSFIVLIFQGAIRNYTADVVGNLLMEIVKNDTQGNYTISYNEVRFDVFTDELRVTDFSIDVDTMAISEEEILAKGSNIVVINTPLLLLKVHSIYELLINDNFVLTYIGIKEPNIRLVQTDKQELTKEFNPASQFSKELKQYLDVFEIDSFYIQNGSFSYINKSNSTKVINDFEIKDFTTFLKNFKINESNPSQLLSTIYSDQFELEINDQEYLLPDNSHKILFNKLSISSIDSIINIDSLRVVAFNGSEKTNQFNLFFPGINIGGIDFSELYNNNYLLINNLTVKNPSVDVSVNAKNTSTESLGPFAATYFKQVDIRNMIINAGSAFLDIPSGVKSVDTIDVAITNLHFDSTSLANNRILNSAHNIDSRIINYRHEIADSIHVLEIENIDINKNDRNIIANNIKLSPIKGRASYSVLKRTGNNMLIRSNIASLAIYDLNLENFMETGFLEAGNVEVDGFNNNIKHYPLLKTKFRNNNTSNSIKYFIGQFSIVSGNLDYEAKTPKQLQNIKLNGFTLLGTSWTTEDDIIQNIKRTYLSTNNGLINLPKIGHTVKIQNASIHGEGDFQAKTISIRPDSASLPFHRNNIKLTDVLINGLKPDDITSNQIIDLDSVIIGNANVSSQQINAYPTGNRKQFEGVKAKYLMLDNANIINYGVKSTITMDSLSLTSTNVEVNKLHLPSLASVNLNELQASFGSTAYIQKGNGQKLTINNGYISDKDSVFHARGIHFNNQKLISGELEQITFRNFNRDAFLKTGDIKFNALLLQRPELIISQVNSSDINYSSHRIKEDIDKIINPIQFDSLLFNEGSVRINHKNGAKTIVTGIKSFIGGFKLDSTSLNDNIFRDINKFDISAKSIVNVTPSNDTVQVINMLYDVKHDKINADLMSFIRESDTLSLSLSFPKIVANGFDIFDIIDHKLFLDSLQSFGSSINIKSASNKETPIDVDKIIANLPLSIKVNKGHFSNAHFSFIENNNLNGVAANLSLNLTISGLNLNNKQPNSRNNPFLSDDISGSIDDFQYALSDSINLIAFDKMNFSTKAKSLSFNNLQYFTELDKYEYGVSLGYQTDWKDLRNLDIYIDSLDYKSFIDNGALKAQKIRVSNGNLKLFRDKRIPFPKDQIREMPQAMLASIKQTVDIDTIAIDNLNVTHGEKLMDGLDEGYISFNNISAMGYNITNDLEKIEKNNNFQVDAKCLLENNATLETQFNFTLNDPENHFNFSANLGTMDIPSLNSILEATAFITVTSGNAKSIKLKADGNDHYAIGKMTFLYEDLKISTINKKNLKTTGMGKVVSTFFANAFVVKKHNSGLSIFAREGDMYFERNPSKVVFDYAARTAMSGIVSSIGVRSNRKEIKKIQKENKVKKDKERGKSKVEKSNRKSNI